MDQLSFGLYCQYAEMAERRIGEDVVIVPLPQPSSNVKLNDTGNVDIE